MNAYVCFYNRQTATVHAASSYAAQGLAARALRVPPKQQYKITVMLAEHNGRPYVHQTASL